MAAQDRRFSARFVEWTADGPDGALGGVRMIAPAHWRPPLDICESEIGLSVVIELGGVDEANTSVSLFDDVLAIEGIRVLDRCADRDAAHVHRVEIAQGPYRIEIPLPFPIDAAGVDASYDRGLLRISLPRLRGAGAFRLLAS